MAVFYNYIKGCGELATIGTNLPTSQSKKDTTDAWTILKWTDKLWYIKDGGGADFMYAENNPQIYYNNANHLPGTDTQYSTGRVLTSSARGQECYYDLNFKTYSNNKVSTFQQNADAFRLTADAFRLITTTFIIEDSSEDSEILSIYGASASNPGIWTNSNWDVNLNGPVSMGSDAKISGSLTVGSMASTGWSKGGISCDITSGISQFWNDKIALFGQIDIGTNGSKSSLQVPSYNTNSEIIAQKSIRVDDGYVKASYFNATSDARAKENIRKADFSALSIVNSLPIYNFNYKNSNKPSIGVIAQEAAKFHIDDFSLVENIEATGENGDYMSIKESKFVYILMKAIQEQQEQIEKLQAEIKQLKA